MEQIRRGRPKVKDPRNQNVNFRVTETELKQAQDICIKHDIRYIDIFLKGLDYWSQK
jgi:regulator of PEP synthase PpsR (kinase-PPPase family)